MKANTSNEASGTLAAATHTFRLGVYAGDYTQPISLLRDLGPFAGMAREDRRLQLVFPPRDPEAAIHGSKVSIGQQIGWNWLIQCDAVFMSHPLGDIQLNALATATMMGIPTWVEYVDDLFAIGPNNPNYHDLFKNKKQVRENCKLAIEMATVTTVVSELCKEAFVKNCGLDDATAAKILVIPEGCMWPAMDLPRRKCVSWRGLSTHDDDVRGVLKDVCAVAKDFPDWDWVLFGAPSEDFVEQLESAAGSERVKVSPYWPTAWHMMTAWASQAPFLHIVPLADNEFNRSKSHLAWLEASAIGAGVIAPKHLPEWHQPGVIQYDGSPLAWDYKDDFATVLRREMLAFDDGKFHPNVATARETIYSERTMRAMNARRWAILRQLALRPQGEKAA